MNVRDLLPSAVWGHFADLNAVPRPSKHEQRVTGFMKHFGESLGLETQVDGLGNVIIKKPGTAGKESGPVVILQSHLDMVHQKNEGTVFNFSTEGIQMYVDGDWVRAKGTTLGADNGMGVAATMALLSSKDVPHPPLVALFTTDEESGMTGAIGLEKGLIEGDIMLNMDTEEDDELCFGCAGGLDTVSTMSCKMESIKPGFVGFRLGVSGLNGGHSGMDIHKGLGNANRILIRLMYYVSSLYEGRVAKFKGGSVRNAIPREGSAVVAVQKKFQKECRTGLENLIDDIKTELAITEPNLIIWVEDAVTPHYVLDRKIQLRVLNALYAIPNGVFRMNTSIEGLVDTSNNLAVMELREGVFTTQNLSRSSIDSSKLDVANQVRAALESAGATVENDNEYPGWTPNPNSPILQLMKEIYTDLFGATPNASSIHAGLECGILSEKISDVDIISFGPTIKGAHSPDERVCVSSVQKFWLYLTTVLAKL